MIIREYRKGDIDTLKEIWVDVFQESVEFIEHFFNLLPKLGSCCVADNHGQIVGMAYALTGQKLISSGDNANPVCGYIYGVAVRENARGTGLGKELSKAAAGLCSKLGAEIVCTLPANSNLYGFYEKAIGSKVTLFRKETELMLPEDFCPFGVTAIDSCEYNERRELLLRHKKHLRFSDESIELERILCTSYGGNLYCCRGGICAGYIDNEKIRIVEILAEENDKALIAYSVAKVLNKQGVIILEEGESTDNSYIVSNRVEVLSGAIWNISFD